MKKETARTLMIVVGVLILLVVLGLASAIWLFTRSVDFATADEASAKQAFEEVRRQFANVKPLLDMKDGEPVLTREVPPHGPDRRLTTLHVIAWDPDDEGITRLDLPFWLLRLKSGPLEISSETGFRGDLNLTVEELERYGSTLVLDYQARRGERVIVWTR